MTYAEALAKDPAGMIPKLAEMYGVDLQSLVAEQPYVDPQVSALQQQLQQLQQAQTQARHMLAAGKDSPLRFRPSLCGATKTR